MVFLIEVEVLEDIELDRNLGLLENFDHGGGDFGPDADSGEESDVVVDVVSRSVEVGVSEGEWAFEEFFKTALHYKVIIR